MPARPVMPRPVIPRRAPAALLPVCLGLIGTALVWRSAAEHGAAPALLAELFIAAAVGVFALVAWAYLRRVWRGPAALPADLRARAGAPGGTEALMFVGVAVLPLSAAAAALVWGVAALLQIALVLRVISDRAAAPPEDPVLTLFLVVPFGGLLLAPVALGAALFWPLLAVYVAVAPAVVWRFASRPVAPAERPAAWVLLAPPSVAAIAAEALYPGGALTLALYSLAALTLAALMSRLRWLTESGFAPSWACFTYPTAAFAGATWALAGRSGDGFWLGAGLVAALAATTITALVAARALTAWRHRRPIAAPIR
ncbi:MAG: hypothetical protein EA355_14315 [Rhodobacteraceae bacterium]|nr:MAG: hypothetical protein EA355_14315 [Paracoccaceae bacterium]